VNQYWTAFLYYIGAVHESIEGESNSRPKLATTTTYTETRATEAGNQQYEVKVSTRKKASGDKADENNANCSRLSSNLVINWRMSPKKLMPQTVP
jgi:hypothetical protein